MIRKVCFFGPKKMCFMQIESVLQTKNRSEPAKNGFSVALLYMYNAKRTVDKLTIQLTAETSGGDVRMYK